MKAFLAPAALSREEMSDVAATARKGFVEGRVASERQWSEFYDEAFAKACEQFDGIMVATDDLTDFLARAPGLFAAGYLDTLRYMCRPTVSADDFKNVSGTGTVAPSRLSQPDVAQEAAVFLLRTLNGRLFPWLERGERPKEADLAAARCAVAALIADQRTKTAMRTAPSHSQERAVRAALTTYAHFETVPAHDIATLGDAPRPGQVFSREASVGGVKADVVLGLYDGRIMALECKVSNSGVNSYKRLNHEVTDKVVKWHNMFGRNGIVGGCVLQGVFEVDNLMSAQDAGVSIFWSHDLNPLLAFIESTRCEYDGTLGRGSGEPTVR